MSHRVAELIERAEQAQTEADKETANKECADIIIRLWEHRYTLPYGQPLAKYAEFLENLTRESVSPYVATDNPDENSWLDILPILESLKELEDDICRHAAIADLSKEELETERKRLEEIDKLLSMEELPIIERLLGLHEQLSSENYILGEIKAPNFASLPVEERTKLVHEALVNINEKRQSLLMSIKSLGLQENKLLSDDDLE